MMKAKLLLALLFPLFVTSHPIAANTAFDVSQNVWIVKFGWKGKSARGTIVVWLERENRDISVCGNYHYRGSVNTRPWLDRTLETSNILVGNTTIMRGFDEFVEVSDENQLGTIGSCIKIQNSPAFSVEDIRLDINGNRYLQH